MRSTSRPTSWGCPPSPTRSTEETGAAASRPETESPTGTSARPPRREAAHVDGGRGRVSRGLAGLVVAALPLACSGAAGGAEPAAPGGLDASSPAHDGGAIEVGDAAARRRPERISDTGLYADIGAKVIASDALPFQPAYALWSDAAEKRRWIRLPAGATIDATDPDHWVLPVGTQLFKEFAQGGKRLETRLIERVAATGRDAEDYVVGAFVWRDDESDADLASEGATNVRGTPHDVPARKSCWTCHLGEPGHALGFSAFQLSHTNGGLDLATLRARGLVPAALQSRPLAGTSVATEAVGYLHANCGHCHNPNGTSWPDTDMVLRWSFLDASIESSKLYTTTVGVPTRSFPELANRVAPRDPDASAVFHRANVRGDKRAMPPIATEIVDPAGVALIRAWIEALPRDPTRP